jgi:hypothetical protein
MPGEAESAKFKAFFEKGEALYQAGEYGPAIYNFGQADAQRVTPEVAYDLAKSHEKLGDGAFTLLYYRLYLRRAPEATDTLQVAEKVGQALAKAEVEGRGFLELWAPRAKQLTVKGLRFVEPPVAMFVPAGDYEVEAEFPSGVKKMLVQVRTGRATSVTFEPVQPPLLTIERALDAQLIAAGIERDSAPAVSGTRLASYIVAGVGVAALIAGIVLGVSANAEAAQAANKANTVSVAQAAAASANGKGVAANVLFGAGGASVVGGVVLFLFSMPEPGMKASGGSL